VITKITKLFPVIILVACALMPVSLGAQSQEEYQKRRRAVRSKMEANSVLILRSGAQSDEGARFRQDDDLFYLTGVAARNTSLILYADSRATGSQPAGPGRPAGPGEILFLSPPAGGRAPAEQKPPVHPGFEAVRSSSEFQSYFDRALLDTASVVYLDYQRSRSLNGPLTADEQILKQARDRGAAFAIKPASSLIAPLRRIKSPAEIELLETAIAITAEAQKEAMRTARPGLYEYQLQSIIEHVFSFNGARRPGFSTIVGSSVYIPCEQ